VIGCAAKHSLSPDGECYKIDVVSESRDTLYVDERRILCTMAKREPPRTRILEERRYVRDTSRRL